MKTIKHNGYELRGYKIFKDGKFVSSSLAPAYGDVMAYFKAEISSIEFLESLKTKTKTN